MHTNNKLTLQAKNIDTLCDAVVAKATELNTSQDLLERATNIQAKFKQVFMAFAKCHDIYDSSGLLEPPVIQQLRKLYNNLKFLNTSQHNCRCGH